MADNSEPAPSKNKKYCLKFNDSWRNKFKFIQKSRKGEGFALCAMCGCAFSIEHGGENDISRYNSLGPDRKKCHLDLEKFLLVLECTLGIEVLGKWR